MKKKLFIFTLISIFTFMFFQTMDAEAVAPNPCYMIGDVEYCPPPTSDTPTIYNIDMDGRSGQSSTYKLERFDEYTFHFTPEESAYYKITYNFLGLCGNMVPVISAKLYYTHEYISGISTEAEFDGTDWACERVYHFVEDPTLKDPRTTSEEFYLEANKTYTIKVNDEQYGVTEILTSYFNINIEGDDSQDENTQNHPVDVIFTPLEVTQHHWDENKNLLDDTTIPFNEYTIDSSIDYPGDKDYYEIEVPINKYIKIYSTGTTDVQASLIDQNGNIIDDNDDFYGRDNNFEINHGLIDEMTYTLIVEHFSSYTTGEYSIVITDRIHSNPDNNEYYATITYHHQYENQYYTIDYVDIYFDHYGLATTMAWDLKSGMEPTEFETNALTILGLNPSTSIPVAFFSILTSLSSWELNKDYDDVLNYASQNNYDGKVHLRIYEWTYKDEDYQSDNYRSIDVLPWDGNTISYFNDTKLDLISITLQEEAPEI